jgi:tripartite-type tricarboxylate transporter receptor subunit TctC
MTHIPYKGGAQAFADFAAGRIQAMVGPLDLDDKMQGKSHPLAVLQAKRSSLRPDTPTLAEIGFPKVNILAWTGFFAPAKTPQPILEQLSSEMVKVFKRPDLQDIFLKLGSNLEGSTPAALGAILKSQFPVWKEAIQFAKIPVE